MYSRTQSGRKNRTNVPTTEYSSLDHFDKGADVDTQREEWGVGGIPDVPTSFFELFLPIIRVLNFAGIFKDQNKN